MGNLLNMVPEKYKNKENAEEASDVFGKMKENGNTLFNAAGLFGKIINE